jgi:hypothetical protein
MRDTSAENPERGGRRIACPRIRLDNDRQLTDLIAVAGPAEPGLDT